MYSIAEYGSMIGDQTRTSPYLEILQRLVRPGSVVLDLGAGPGLFSLVACRLGARRAYAIEPSPAICVAKDLAAANGFADRIVCIRDVSTKVTLPEPVDLIVSDLHGRLPQFGQSVVSLIDARRFLGPGGQMAPTHDSMWAAVVHADDLHDRYVGPWERASHGFDLGIAKHLVLNAPRNAWLATSDLISAPACWATLDYRTLTDPNCRADLEFVATRTGIAHGLAVWFECWLADDLMYSSGPGSTTKVFPQAFYPWLTPVSLEHGDRIAVSLAARLFGDEYIWTWTTRVTANGSNEVKASFSQSTFHGEPVCRDVLHEQSLDHVPVDSPARAIDRFVLQRVDGRASLLEIARATQAQFPEVLRSEQDAADRVRRVLRTD